jgi:hypothetical protein
MQKKYFCAECKAECPDPTYLRLHLTACGWKRVSKLARWQRSIPVGHFCEKCLLLRVRTALGRDFALSQVEGSSRPASPSVGLRTQEATS